LKICFHRCGSVSTLSYGDARRFCQVYNCL
jgi:hypothetical protein